MGPPKHVPEPRAADIGRIERQLRQRRERLKELERLDCFHTVPTEELEGLIDLGTFRAFPIHKTIIHERDQRDFLYILLQGSVRLVLHDKEGHEVLMGILDRGDCYGVGALFGDFFRRSGAYTETDCYVLQLPLVDVRALLATAPVLHTVFRQLYMQRMAEFTLVRVPLFSHLLPVERMALVRSIKSKHYPRGSVVVQQNEPADALYLIESGQVIVEEYDQAIATLNEGDFFGEMALLSHEPRAATVRTLTPADILILPAEAFHLLLAEHPGLKARFQDVLTQRRSAGKRLRDDQGQMERLNQIVQHGLLRGSHLLIRTPELCPPGCRICEEACTARHGNTRLHLNGVLLGSQDILSACRQCHVGAECMEACPEDAFAWDDRGALHITDACTGCGECIPACPYEAVDRVPRTGDIGQQTLVQRFNPIQYIRGLGRYSIPLEATGHSHRADKCDLCHGHEDLACLSACPTGSLRLVPVEEVLPI